MREAVCVAIILLMAGCTESEPTGPNIFVVAQGTQLNRGDLHIGIHSVTENSAALVVRIGSLNTTERVVLSTGEEKKIAAYQIKNLGTKKYFLGGFKPGSPSGSVRLQVKEVKKIIQQAQIKVFAKNENNAESHVADVLVKDGRIEMVDVEKSPEAERLSAALQELSNTTLFTTIDTFEVINGSRVMALKKYPVSPYSPEYIHTLGDTLSLEYGYIVDYEK